MIVNCERFKSKPGLEKMDNQGEFHGHPCPHFLSDFSHLNFSNPSGFAILLGPITLGFRGSLGLQKGHE